MLKVVAVSAFAALVVSGPLQHIGAVPETALGNFSKQMVKSVLGFTSNDALASCKPGFRLKGNNGFGNGGGDPAPGRSGTNNSPNAGQKQEDKVR